MMRKLSIPALALVLIAATGLVMAFCGAEPTAPLPSSDQHTLDSIKVTTPLYHAERDTLIVHETTFVARAEHAADAARHERASADNIAIVADSLEQTALDSAAYWHDAADARKAETQTLRAANDSLSTALEYEHKALLAADARAALDSTRVVALNDFNDRLSRDLEKERHHPSSIKVFAAGVLTGTLATVAMSR